MKLFNKITMKLISNRNVFFAALCFAAMPIFSSTDCFAQNPIITQI